MKMLLDTVVYDVPTEVLMAWMNITPKFRDNFKDRWSSYSKQQFGTGNPNAQELNDAISGFYDDNRDWYFQLMFEVMMDLREAMKADFEEYRSTMTAEELESYAQKPNVGSLKPVIKQPIRIDITSDDT